MLGLLVPWTRAIATVGAVAFVAAACINVVRGQQIHHYLPGSNWDGFFTWRPTCCGSAWSSCWPTP